MAKAKKYKSGVNLELPFKIVNGSKKFDIEMTVKDVSFISNALKEFEKSNLSKLLTSSQIKEYKKLFIFFENLLEV